MSNPVVASWLMGLAEVTASSEPVTETKIGAIGSLISREFPAEAFTLDSLAAVAAQSPFFPVFADLRSRLGAWWRDNRPQHRALADDTLRGLSEDDRLWVGYWRRRHPEKVAEERAIVASGAVVSAEQMPVAMLNSMVRNKSPGAWAVIAAAEGWVELERGPATEGAIAAVAAKLRIAGLSVHRSAMPEVEPARPQPRHLSPEQLHAARKAQGVRVAR